MKKTDFYSQIDVPDGWYEGWWSGRTLRFRHDGHEIMCDVECGLRGKALVRFRVECGRVDCESIKKLQ